MSRWAPDCPLNTERTTAAFVRMLRGNLEFVRAALQDLDDQEFAAAKAKLLA